MAKNPSFSSDFCIPQLDEIPLRGSCEGFRLSHIGLSVKNPPLSVRIRSFFDLIAYILIRPPISILEEPKASAMNYELPVSDDGLSLSGDPQESAEEVKKELGREIKYRGFLKIPADSERLIEYARIASLANLELKLSERRFEIYPDKLAKELDRFSEIVYSKSAQAYSELYNIPSELVSVPIVIGYGDKLSRALAAAYAAHRGLPLILARKVSDVSEFAEKYSEVFYESSRNVGDLEGIAIAKADVPNIDPKVESFLRRYIPARIVYFSPKPTSHGLLSDNSKEPVFLGSFVPEFRIPTDDLDKALELLSEA